MNTGNDPKALIKAAQAVASQLQADVVLFNQDIDVDTASKFHDHLDGVVSPKDTVFMILVTNGGDAHAAYVLARELQLRYKKVILCIAGDCYSAGTLIVLCAHEVVITPRGRLGPLDVQIIKKDELDERFSGVTASIALEELSRNAFNTFTNIALSLKRTFRMQLSFRTAMEMASSMTAQMMGEMYKQIDPIRLAEDARALKIAAHYGRILDKTSKNLRPRSIERLTKEYPSHQCIIDATEATELFVNCRSASKEEAELLRLLGPMATDSADEESALMIVFPQTARGDTTNDRKRRGKGLNQGDARDTPSTNGQSDNPPVPGRRGGAPREASRGSENGGSKNGRQPARRRTKPQAEAIG